MQVMSYPDVAAFLQAAQTWLEAHEALNNLVLGHAVRLRIGNMLLKVSEPCRQGFLVGSGQ